MEPVGRAIVFRFHTKHLGLVVPNDRVRDDVALHPGKLVGVARLDPHKADYLEEMEKCFPRAGLKGRKPTRTFILWTFLEWTALFDTS